MAVSNCSRTCRQCGSTFVRTAKGQPTKYCSAACLSRNARKCEKCGSALAGLKRMRWCSDTCMPKRKQKHYDTKPRGPFACMVCGVSYMTLRARGEGEKYCSIACSGVSKRRIPDYVRAAKAKARLDNARKRELIKARKKIEEDVRNNKRAIRKAKMFAKSRSRCKICGAEYPKKQSFRFCSDRCRNSAHRAQRSKEKAIRRQRIRRVSHSIDPIKVFERDRWRCHICGMSTPVELRGKCNDRAPELDHVISLKDGGTHTWGNVRCACRKCNIEKSASSFGQLGFDIAA